MRKRSKFRHWTPLLLVAGSLACGSEAPTADPGAGSAWIADASSEDAGAQAQRAPVIETLRIEPSEPAPGDRIRAIARLSAPDASSVRVGYAWSLDGRPLPEGGAEIVLGELAPGTRVEVVATASDGRQESEAVEASVTVRNRRPVITGLTLDPAGDVPLGHPVVARPEARDPDGDAIGFRYQWSVNGRAVSEDGPRLDTQALRRGDAIQVRVWARDDRDESDPVYSHAVKVANSRPEIVSLPGGLGADGVFRYAIEARDPDGDRGLRYYLNQGPEGMTLDPILGEVTWRPTPGDVGVHAVEIAVQDSAGETALQSFQLSVSPEGSAPAAPARQ